VEGVASKACTEGIRACRARRKVVATVGLVVVVCLYHMLLFMDEIIVVLMDCVV